VATVGPLDRREFLTLALGGSLAAWSCKSGASDRVPPGRIVGASDARGHRLREQNAVWPAADHNARHRVVIVGAGVAGLSAARELDRLGMRDFVVLELESVVGGTSRGGSTGSFAHPWGAHYVPVPDATNRPLIELLQELGAIEGIDAQGQPIPAESCLVRDPAERVFFRGRWYEGLWLEAGANAADRAELERFQKLIDSEVASGEHRIPTRHQPLSERARELDRISMRQWLDRERLDSARLRWWIDYACRDDYGLTLDQTSAWAGLFYFASRVPYPGAPEQPLLSWPEGNARLVAHLARGIEQRVHPDSLVVDVVTETNSVRVLALHGDHARSYECEHLIMAAPQFVARHLLRDWRTDPPQHLQEFHYGAWLVANLWLDRRPPDRGFPLCWDNVLYESRSLGYVVATHQTEVDHGSTVLTYYHPFAQLEPQAARTLLLEATHAELAEIVCSDLQRAHPEIRTITRSIDLMRWGHAMIQPRPGLLSSAALAAARQSYRGVHFAHCDISGLALFEEAFENGRRAAQAIRELCYPR
jgi:protoporphyrinogen oxidase